MVPAKNNTSANLFIIVSTHGQPQHVTVDTKILIRTNLDKNARYHTFCLFTDHSKDAAFSMSDSGMYDFTFRVQMVNGWILTSV